jgi:hypothetical protein
MHTNEQIEQLRKLIAMMRDEGVSEFTAGDIKVSFDAAPRAPVEMSSEEKLSILREELQKSAKDADEELYYSV